MKIRLLGTGTSQGIPIIGCECKTCLSSEIEDKRMRTSCLIEIAGKRIQIDTGPDFRQQMLLAEAGEIHAVLITHEHYDHVGGLDDIRPFNFKYKKDMPVFALPRVAEGIRNRFDYIFKTNPYPGAPQIELMEIDGESSFDIEDIRIIPIHIMHGSLPILGFRIRDFAYLTDVKEIPETEFEKLRNLEILVLSALRHEEHHSHLTIKEAVSLAQQINAGKTYFTHFSHLAGTHEEITSQLPDGVFAGYDGLEMLAGQHE